MKAQGKLTDHNITRDLYAYCSECRAVFVDDLDMDGDLECPNGCLYSRDNSAHLYRLLPVEEVAARLGRDSLSHAQDMLKGGYWRITAVEREVEGDEIRLSFIVQVVKHD